MSYTNGLDDPTLYFNTVLYTGNGSARTITGVGFQPDWVWLKGRSATSNHYIYDSVRGDNLFLQTNKTNADGNSTSSSAGGIGSQASDGFTIVAGTSNTDNVNTSGTTYVAWNWKAGGSASSNTDGSITSSVSANTTAGFSIVSYTGTGSNATIGHGLGVAPSWIITKTRSTVQPWRVYHKGVDASAPEDYGLILNDTSVRDNDNTAWNDTAPTSSVFSVGTSANTNGSGSTFIAYCFAEKKGFSKFGSYTGNGNADGTFVYTGFKPAWILVKRSDGGTDNWNLYDNKRLGYNTNYSFLIPNESNAENTTTSTANLDILSNGFKIRGSTGHTNTSGGTYIFMCFAESALVNSNGVPNNAR